MTIKKKITIVNIVRIILVLVFIYFVTLSINAFTNLNSKLIVMSQVRSNVVDADAEYSKVETELSLLIEKFIMKEQSVDPTIVDSINKHGAKYIEHLQLAYAINKDENVSGTIASLLQQVKSLLASIDSIVAQIQSGQTDLNAKFNEYSSQALEVNSLFNELMKTLEKMNLNTLSNGTTMTEINQSVVLLIILLYAIMESILGYRISAKVLRPLGLIISIMNQIAQGKYQVEIPAKNRNDEIGEIAKALEVFKDNALNIERINTEQTKIKQTMEVQKREELKLVTDKFNTTVRHVADMVGSAAVEMEVTAKNMANTSNNNIQYIQQLAKLSSDTSENVNTVANAAEELSNSVTAINKQMNNSANITMAAVERAEIANKAIQELAASTNKIGDIINLINDIAEQINLLALNATIEAARAGDAGKGFAVVAAEVKNLAKQTAKATEEIAAQISSIQTETNNAVEFIQNINHTITEISDISNNITITVQQQGSSTQNIANNIHQVARSVSEVSDNAQAVQVSTSENSRAISEMVNACVELAKQSTILNEEVDKFLNAIQSG